MKNLQKRCFTLLGRLWRSITFSPGQNLKICNKMYFSPCIDEDNKKKNCNKIRAKMKTLEAKPFDQNVENRKQENRLFTSTVLAALPRGKIELVHAHSEVIKQFDSISLLKLLFLVRNWHCWSRKAFPRQMTPQSREKTAKTAVFRHRWQAWKVVRLLAAVRRHPRTPRNWRCSFAFFESFLWHFYKKQRAEVIFRLSRPVSCKNQENGAAKQWSLHAPLKPVVTVGFPVLGTSS